MLGIIGDQFDHCKQDEDHREENSAHSGLDGSSERGEIPPGDWPEICGATLSVRQSEDILSVWNRVDGDLRLREQIR